MNTLVKVTTGVLAVIGVIAVVGFAAMAMMHFSMMGNWAW